MKNITVKEFVDGLLKFSKLINTKEETLIVIKDIAANIF